MAIKSDKWISRMCNPPAFVIEYTEKNTIQFFTPKDQHEFELAQNFSGGIVRRPTENELAAWKPMIEPFISHAVRYENDQDIDAKRAVVSYGRSSYGYDVQVDTKFKIFTNVNSAIVDPKNFNDKCYVEVDGADDGYVIIPPNGFALANTLPYFRIPRDVLVICLGKSTYARCGIIVNVTPLEPEWEGQVVLEFSNTTNLPAKIYVREGVAQFLFLQSDEQCEVSYKDRGGKYMGQTGITLPKA